MIRKQEENKYDSTLQSCKVVVNSFALFYWLLIILLMVMMLYRGWQCLEWMRNQGTRYVSPPLSCTMLVPLNYKMMILVGLFCLIYAKCYLLVFLNPSSNPIFGFHPSASSLVKSTPYRLSLKALSCTNSIWSSGL